MNEKVLNKFENLLQFIGLPIELQAVILNFFGDHKIVLQSREPKPKKTTRK